VPYGFARHDDHGLAVYAAASGQTRLRRAARHPDQDDAELAKVLQIAAQFPRLNAFAVDQDQPPGDPLEFGLGLILDALEQRSSARP
jgi:hypothetical protein